MLVEDCRALGKTVLLSDIPIHREQAYPAAHAFDPESVDELVALLARLWPDLRPGPDLVAERLAREEDDRLTLAVPGTEFSAEEVLETLARLAKAVGARTESFSALLRLGD